MKNKLKNGYLSVVNNFIYIYIYICGVQLRETVKHIEENINRILDLRGNKKISGFWCWIQPIRFNLFKLFLRLINYLLLRDIVLSGEKKKNRIWQVATILVLQKERYFKLLIVAAINADFMPELLLISWLEDMASYYLVVVSLFIYFSWNQWLLLLLLFWLIR